MVSLVGSCSPGGTCIFNAEAEFLKITAMANTPFDIKDSVCELLKIKNGTYSWNISETGKNSKKRMFRFDAGRNSSTEIVISSRGNQFTFVIKKNNKATQLIGKLKNEKDCQQLVELMHKIDGQTDGKWLNAKENNVPNTKPIKSNRPCLGPKSFLSASGGDVDKKTERIPLSDRRGYQTITNPKSRVCSSEQEIQTTPIKSSSVSGDNDVKITAVGAKKAADFYQSSNAHNKGNIKYIYPIKHLFTKSSAQNGFTFRGRNSWRIPKVNKNNNNDNTVVGFSNLGNTCYMNAILQCLLNIPNFFQELNNQDNLDVVQHAGLYNSLCNLGILKYSHETLENQRYALKRVKAAISSAAERFSGYAQHDAHEFLCQCLDQLKEDLFLEMKKKFEEQDPDLLTSDSGEQTSYSCPIKENFESTILHTIKCQCGEEVLKEEACHDFSLVIPEFDENSAPVDRSINELLHLYFMEEEIEYNCEKCNGNSSVLSHQFCKLPRVLILHIKRYDIYDTKRSDRVLLPKSIDMSVHVTYKTKSPVLFNYKKFKIKGTKDLDKNSTSSAEKRKSTEAFGSEPLNKSFKSYNNWDFANSFLLSNSKDGYTEAEKTFTRLKTGSDVKNPSPVKSSNLPINNSTPKVDTEQKHLTDIDSDYDEFEISMNNLTSLSDDEEDELNKVLELSRKEYEDQQNQELTKFSEDKVLASNINDLDFSVSGNMNKVDDAFSIQNTDDSFFKNHLQSPESIFNVENSYKLVGIVNHHGDNTRTGHYTSDSFDFKSKTWRSYNDSSVKEITEHEVRYGRTQSAYVVFYMHNICYDSILEQA